MTDTQKEIEQALETHRTLYEVTGNIADINTLLVPRSALAQQGGDDYKAWYNDAMAASNEAGFVGASAAQTIRELNQMLIAAQAAHKPLSIERVVSMGHRGTLDEHIRVVRMTEAAHGIVDCAAPAEQTVCKECGDTGSIYAIDGAGPFDCYACGRKSTPTPKPDARNVVEQMVGALEEIESMEGSENDEWDGVERVIPEMAATAKTAREAGQQWLEYAYAGMPTPYLKSVKVPGMAVQALAGEIIQALLADEKDGGYDLTAGMFGPEFSTLVRRWAAAEWRTPLTA